MAKTLYFIFAFLLFAIAVNAQDVYKTPSGERYHLASCRMVKNVSEKLTGVYEINDSKLTPCKICKPPPKHLLEKRLTNTDKSVGTSTTVRCKGTTKKGTRCKHMTKLKNGYCFQHTKQANSSKKYRAKATATSLCGARTASGKPCKRKVKNGGRCYQHR